MNKILSKQTIIMEYKKVPEYKGKMFFVSDKLIKEFKTVIRKGYELHYANKDIVKVIFRNIKS